MSSVQNNSNSAVDLLNKAMGTALFRVKLTQENLVKIESAEKQLKALTSNLMVASFTVDKLKKVRSAVDDFNDQKRSKSLSALHSALYSAHEVIGTAEPAHWSAESAAFVTEEGLMVDMMEGSGYRSVLSLFARSVMLSNTDHIPFLLLDEPLAMVNADNSAAFSAYLPVLAQDKQIILIEQKHEAFAQLEDYVEYNFNKLDKICRGRRVR